MLDINWEDISPALFEKLCAAILSKNGFINIQWFGKLGSDKGRDLVAEKRDSPLGGLERTEKWLVQCKRYTVKNLGKSEIKECLDSAMEHQPDNVLFIVTNTTSANVKDWLATAIRQYPFKVYLWEENQIRSELHTHHYALLEELPELHEGKEPVWLYKRESGQIIFGSNEFEEIEIVIVNCDEMADAKKRVGEFLAYVMKNGFDWWE